MTPVLIQMPTYSESAGVLKTLWNLLFAGTPPEFHIPTPSPYGASFKYFFMASWFILRVLLEASSLLKAERIRRIC